MSNEQTVVRRRTAGRFMAGAVYRIRCLVNGKLYIGSTTDTVNRSNVHFALLRRGKHHSLKLQRAWNKYGPDAFDFDIIEPFYDTAVGVREREVYWIKKLDTYRNGYNQTEAVGPGVSIPPEVRKKMSEGSKRAGKDPELRRLRSERAKAQHAAGNLGRQCWKK